jgi:hypothetical protein
VDIPAESKAELIEALEKHMPMLDRRAGGSNDWDDRLHPMHFAPFVDALVRRGSR